MFKRSARKGYNATEQNWFQLLLKNFCNAISTARRLRSKSLLTLGCVLAFTSFSASGANAGGSASARELDCLATAIYFEARGESEQGQMAVAQVILNRAASGKFPATICGVVYQGESRRDACQFSFACDGVPETKSDGRAWRRAQDIAEKAVAGQDLVSSVQGAIYYHASYVSPYWAPSMSRVATVGQHIFYKG